MDFSGICRSNRTLNTACFQICVLDQLQFATLGIVCCLVMASFFGPKRRHVMSPLYNENVSFTKEKGGLSLGRGIL